MQPGANGNEGHLLWFLSFWDLDHRQMLRPGGVALCFVLFCCLVLFLNSNLNWSGCCSLLRS